MRRVSRIDLVLENCEVICVPEEKIRRFHVTGISRTVERIAVNSIRENTRCEELFVELLPGANVATAFQTALGDVLPFDRLVRHRDICAIDVIYEDGTNEYIYVPWGGDSDYTNESQRSELTEEGRLQITVGETEGTE